MALKKQLDFNSISNQHKILIIKLFQKKQQQQIQAFQIEIRVTAKTQTRCLKNKPKTQTHLTLTKAQMCNYFVYQKSLVHVVTLLIPLKQLTSQI